MYVICCLVTLRAQRQRVNVCYLLFSHVESTATASQQSSRKDKTDNASSKVFDIRLENFDVAYGEK